MFVYVNNSKPIYTWNMIVSDTLSSAFKAWISIREYAYIGFKVNR